MGVIILIALMASQIIFLATRTKIKNRDGRSQPRRLSDNFWHIGRSAKKTEPRTKLENHIDPSIFTKFQQKINESQESSKTSLAGNISEQNEVILSISAKGKKAKVQNQQQPISRENLSEKQRDSAQKMESVAKFPSKPTSAKQDVAKTNIKTSEQVPLGSLFDDLQEPLPEKSVQTEEKKPIERVMDNKSQPPEPKQNVPIIAHETLTSQDMEPNEEHSKDQAALVLTISRDQFQKKDFQESITTIKQFLEDGLKELSGSENIISLIQLKGENEFALKQFEKASKTWQDLFKKYVSKDQPQFLSLLEELILKYTKENHHRFAVHFLFTALNEYRQQQDFNKMDQAYHQIEIAYQQLEDWPRLIQTYQNHLTIKKTIKDFEGQLELLDNLGKMLYDQGDAKGSKKYYEQRLSIENQISKAR